MGDLFGGGGDPAPPPTYQTPPQVGTPIDPQIMSAATWRAQAGMPYLSSSFRTMDFLHGLGGAGIGTMQVPQLRVAQGQQFNAGYGGGYGQSSSAGNNFPQQAQQSQPSPPAQQQSQPQQPQRSQQQNSLLNSPNLPPEIVRAIATYNQNPQNPSNVQYLQTSPGSSGKGGVAPNPFTLSGYNTPANSVYGSQGMPIVSDPVTGYRMPYSIAWALQGQQRPGGMA